MHSDVVCCPRLFQWIVFGTINFIMRNTSAVLEKRPRSMTSLHGKNSCVAQYSEIMLKNHEETCVDLYKSSSSE